MSDSNGPRPFTTGCFRSVAGVSRSLDGPQRTLQDRSQTFVSPNHQKPMEPKRLAEKSAWDRPLSTSNLSLEVSVLRRGFSCSPSEDGARHQTAATRVVVVEKPADQLSGGVQSGNGLALRIEHAPVLVYVQSTEGEGYAAGDGECEVGRGVQRESPVGLGRLDALSVFSVLYSRVELAGTNGGVVLLDRPLQCLCLDASIVGKLGHSVVRFVAR